MWLKGLNLRKKIFIRLKGLELKFLYGLWEYIYVKILVGKQIRYANISE